jgi:peptidoglycan biosynthesis protein MviN/MurJ (putative lipid II flippase)
MTPMRVSLAMVALNFILSVILIQGPLKEAGLALATAISSFAGCLSYAVLLHRRGTGAVLNLATWLRPLVAVVVMGLAVWLLLHHWPQPDGRASGYAVLRLGAAVALGMLVYLGLAGTTWLRRRRDQGTNHAS